MATTSLDRGAARRVAAARLRLDTWTRIGPLADDRLWLLPYGLTAYVLITTWTWEFPDWTGVPFPAVWVAAVLAGLRAWTWRRGEVTPMAATAVVVVAAMLLTDIAAFWTQPLRDLVLYLKAGDAWMVGAPPYMRIPLVAAPADLSNYPYLYPPPTLPLFGALSMVPLPLAAGAWVGGSAALFLLGLRWLGIGWRWSLLLLAWPPVVQGLHVGNVAIPLFALFAAAVRFPALLALPPVFKVYSGIAALWLLRREHWRSLVIGVAAILALGAVTLPLVGITLWQDWFVALREYQVSQRLLPNLYGFGLARHLPWLVVIIVAVTVTILALRARDPREQLSRLGVATVVGSPSLFSHGWLVALPALLRLKAPWFWLALGITACAPGHAWFAAAGLAVASWYLPSLRRGPGDEPWHPLESAAAPWPAPEARR